MTEALVGLGLMMVLALLRIPIAIAMGVVGFLGVAYLRDWNFAPAMAMVETKVYETGRNYTLSVVPLFILMGNFVTLRRGCPKSCFALPTLSSGICAEGWRWRRWWPAPASAPSAVRRSRRPRPWRRSPTLPCGGSVIRIACPPASIAAGGTLGILIPPSTLMVIYGVMTETNIGKLFAAGILPGILATFLLCLAVQWTVFMDPASGPRGESSSWGERLRALEGVWGVALAVHPGHGRHLWRRLHGDRRRRASVRSALVFRAGSARAVVAEAFSTRCRIGRTTAMLFAILTGALMFAEFVNYTTMPDDLKTLVTTFNLSPVMVVTAICVIYVLLGTAMEELSMILLTVPVFFPLIVHLGFDPIWFGILIVVVVEIGLISPPVGMNLSC